MLETDLNQDELANGDLQEQQSHPLGSIGLQKQFNSDLSKLIVNDGPSNQENFSTFQQNHVICEENSMLQCHSTVEMNGPNEFLNDSPTPVLN